MNLSFIQIQMTKANFGQVVYFLFIELLHYHHCVVSKLKSRKLRFISDPFFTPDMRADSPSHSKRSPF